MNEDRPVLLATVLLLPVKCASQRCIGYVDIAGRSPAMGRQTSAGWGKCVSVTRQTALLPLHSTIA